MNINPLMGTLKPQSNVKVKVWTLAIAPLI